MRKYLFGSGLAIAASLVVGVSALAAPAPKPSMNLWSAQDATASWTSHHDALVFNETTTNGAYAGASFNHVSAALPVEAPSFTEQSSVDQASGGSPRLVIVLSDGGNIDLYADNMTTNPEAATAWDSNGGQAGYLYHVDYATAVADHPGATVSTPTT